MTAKTEVKIIVLAKDQSSKVFKGIGNAAKTAGSKLAGLGDAFGKVGETANKAGNVLSVGVTAPLIALGAASVQSAMQADRVSKALDGLTGSSEKSAMYIKSIELASLGAISKMDAMAIASRALSFGVVDNTKKMKDLTKIAITLGKAQGLDATTAVSDLTTALARQSPMILDNLGITMKLSDAYAIYAKSIGKNVDQLDAEEKQQAFLRAALLKGEEAMVKMGGVTEDSATSAERATAQFENAQIAIGNELMPIVAKFTGKVADMLTAFNELDAGTKKTIVGLGGVAAAAGPALKVFGGVASTAPKVVTGLSNVGVGFQLAAKGAKVSEVATLGSSAAFGAALAPIAAVVAVLAAAAVTYKTLKDAEEQADAASDGLTGTLQEMADEGKSATKIAQELSSAQRRANKVWEEAPFYIKPFVDIEKATTVETKDLMATLIKAASSTEELYQAMDLAGLSTDETAIKIAEASTKFGEISIAMKQGSMTYDSWSERARTAQEVSTQLAEAMAEATEEVEQNSDAFLANLGLAEKFSGSISEYQEFTSARTQLIAEGNEEELATLEAGWAMEEAQLAEHFAKVEVAYLQNQLKTQELTEEQRAQTEAAMMALGLQFGLVTEESLKVADGTEAMRDAMSRMNPEDWAASMGQWQAAITDGVVSSEEMVAMVSSLDEETSKTMLEIFPQATGEMRELALMMEANAMAGDEAAASIKGAGEQSGRATTEVERLKEQALNLEENMLRAAMATEALNEALAKTKRLQGDDGVSGLASGTSYWRGGMALVGETGPELVSLPQGSAVYSAAETRQIFNQQKYGGDTYDVTINDPMAMAMFMEQQRQRRIMRSETVM